MILGNESPHDPRMTWARRTFLAKSFAGVGSMALASLLTKDASGSVGPRAWPALDGYPHRPPRAKRIVHLCMAGGPSHIEALDPKPELDRIDGQPFPDSFTQGQQLAQLQNGPIEGS